MARRAAPPEDPAAAPTREQILDFIEKADAPVGKREIARAFGIKGPGRDLLKATLRELENSGALERGRGRRLGRPGTLPEVGVIHVTGLDDEGAVVGRPARWDEDGSPPVIRFAPPEVRTPGRGGPPARTGPAALPGMRVLARLVRTGIDSYEGRVIRVLAEAPSRFLAVYDVERGRGRLSPTDRRLREDYRVPPGQEGGAEAGELVTAEQLPGRERGMRTARVIERLGDTADPRTVSLIAIHTRGIPHVFPPAALAEAEAARPANLVGGRVDLRDVPLVTIDGSDARDFDDAVWAEPDGAGWRVLVAIADVAWYVRPGSALDDTAYERGNSVYFPDRVVPMLPEALSNGLCSLRPKEDRACMAVEMRLDKSGRLVGHRFMRGLMRSAARLTYEQVQDAVDGRPDDLTGPLLEPVIRPLYGAFESLAAARRKRGTLDLDAPERRIVIGPDGQVRAILPRARLDSHRLIEEMMIAANVAAAETLERADAPCMYRVHATPDAAKVEGLRKLLAELGIKLAAGQLMKPQHFTALLEQVRGGPLSAMVSELVLRAQAQAVYSPQNIGHFGLGLARYAHFTSPIRRYSDLLVHRALIASQGFGDGGLPAGADARFTEAGEHLSMTERRADAAERDADERFTALYLARHVGDEFAGRVTGVARFGLFVRLLEIGADGLVPVSTLPADYYDHDDARHALVGRRTARTYRLGDAVSVRLAAADAVTGSLVLQVIDGGTQGSPRRGRGGGRPR